MPKLWTYIFCRPNSKGLVVGITTVSPNASNKRDIHMAALESIAFQVRDVLERMQSDSNICLTTLLADGGTTFFYSIISEHIYKVVHFPHIEAAFSL